MIRPDAYSAMYKAITHTSADIVVAPLYKIDNDKYFARHLLPFPVNKPIDSELYMNLIFTERYNNVAVWNKLYRYELVKNHPFVPLLYEDVAWTPYILSWAKNICYIDKICYEWDRVIRPTTLSNELSNRSKNIKFEQRYQALKFFYENGNPERKECLAYLMAKRLYNQGVTSKYADYFDALINYKDILLDNKFLLADKEYYNKISKILS